MRYRYRTVPVRYRTVPYGHGTVRYRTAGASWTSTSVKKVLLRYGRYDLYAPFKKGVASASVASGAPILHDT